MAEKFRDSETRRKVLKIADEYDQMATQAATLEIQLQELAASSPLPRQAQGRSARVRFARTSAAQWGGNPRGRC
jgi:hypothetical protein